MDALVRVLFHLVWVDSWWSYRQRHQIWDKYYSMLFSFVHSRWDGVVYSAWNHDWRTFELYHCIDMKQNLPISIDCPHYDKHLKLHCWLSCTEVTLSWGLHAASRGKQHAASSGKQHAAVGSLNVLLVLLFCKQPYRCWCCCCCCMPIARPACCMLLLLAGRPAWGRPIKSNLPLNAIFFLSRSAS